MNNAVDKKQASGNFAPDDPDSPMKTSGAFESLEKCGSTKEKKRAFSIVGGLLSMSEAATKYNSQLSSTLTNKKVTWREVSVKPRRTTPVMKIDN